MQNIYFITKYKYTNMVVLKREKTAIIAYSIH
jgi:hypothetical protein